MKMPGAAQHRGFDSNPPGLLQRVFVEAITILDEANVPYVLIGGLASAELGRPRCSADVDVLVKPVDAGTALAALGAEGFATDETNPHWLYKATKEGVLVDILFKGPKDIYLDEPMLARSRIARVLEQSVRVAPPEDLIVMKALVHDEETPRHWHDALALVAAGDIDWDYLVHRARKGNRRVLSLLLYALSMDLVVPRKPLDALYGRIFCGSAIDVG
jgi:predicted nucleotidyltransferase